MFTGQICLFKGNKGGFTVPYLDVGDAGSGKKKKEIAEDSVVGMFEAVYGTSERSPTPEYEGTTVELLFSSVDYHDA